MSRLNHLLPRPRVPGIAIVGLALVACASTSLSRALPEVTQPPFDAEAECLRLGPVVGTADPFFGGLRSDASLIESARHDALVQGLRAGATHVQLSDEPRRWPSGMFGGGHGVTVVGVAYNCTALKVGAHAPAATPSSLPAPSASPAGLPPTPAGCAKDTDCKGDRICVAGACTDPIRRPDASG